MDKLAQLLGVSVITVILLALGVAVGVALGYYNAFVIHKALEYFLPEWAALITVAQIWALNGIKTLITHSKKDPKEDKNKDSSEKLLELGKLILESLTKSSFIWFCLYAMKFWIL
jgi:ribose/xylose/arabinose/galactoside ABC-type transport system permease subunit